MASIHYNLGTLLQKIGDKQDSQRQFQKAIALFREELEDDKKPLGLTRMGDALASTGNFEEATIAFRQALSMEPDNPSHYFKLARSLEYCGRYDQAIEMLQNAIVYMSDKGQTQTTTEMKKHLDSLKAKKSTRPE